MILQQPPMLLAPLELGSFYFLSDFVIRCRSVIFKVRFRGVNGNILHFPNLSASRDLWHLVPKEKKSSCLLLKLWQMESHLLGFISVEIEAAEYELLFTCAQREDGGGWLLLHLWQLVWPLLQRPLRPWDAGARDLLIGVWHQVFIRCILLLFPDTNVTLN